jgi:hypothetical protein
MNEELLQDMMRATKTEGYPSDLLRLANAIEAEDRKRCMQVCEVWAPIVDAALRWVYCPAAGGYRDGRSVEDCCEELAAAVEAMTKVVQSDDWLTEEQSEERLRGPIVFSTEPARSACTDP